MRIVSLFGLSFTLLVNSQLMSGNLQANRTILACVFNQSNAIISPHKVNTISTVLYSIWICMAVAALICNSLIIHAVSTHVHMRTSINYLIVNMAAGDLTVSIILLLAGSNTIYNGNAWSGNEFFGEYIYCRFSRPLLYLCMLSSIYSLVAITLDQFLAVVRPLKFHNARAIYVIIAVWLAALVMPVKYSLREFTYCSTAETIYCQTKKDPLFGILFITCGYVIPHVVIVVLHMAIAYKLCTRRVPGEHAQDVHGQTAARKSSRKVSCMIICTILAFEASWGPLFIIYVYQLHILGKQQDFDLKMLIYMCLVVTNGISNAIIYAIFSENFRHAFKKVLSCKTLRSKLISKISMQKITPN